MTGDRTPTDKTNPAEPQTPLDYLAIVGKSAVNAAVLNPVNGLVQLANKGLEGADVNFRLSSVPTFERTDNARMFSGAWFADNFGTGVGMVLPVLASRGAVGMAGRTLEGTKIAELAASVPLASKLAPITNATLGGSLYGFALTPTDEHGNFWDQRWKNAVIMGTTFGVQHAGSMLALGGLSKVGVPTAEAIFANSIAGRLTHLGTNAASGALAGGVNAEMSAKINEGRWATGDEVGTSMVTFAVTGAMLDGANMAIGARSARTTPKQTETPAPEQKTQQALPPDAKGRQAAEERNAENDGKKIDIQARLSEGAEADRVGTNSKGVITASEQLKSQLETNIKATYKDDQAPGRIAEFNRLVEDFKVREYDGVGLEPAELTKTLDAVHRVLTTEKTVVDLSSTDRLGLAKQMLYEATHPTEAHWGSNQTAGPAGVMQMLLDRHPGKTTQAVADLITTGKYTSTGSSAVEVDLSPQTLSKLPDGFQKILEPDSEARASLALAETTGTRPTQTGSRSYFQQLAQTLAVNTEGQSRTDFKLIYAKGQAEGKDTAERLFKQDADGRITAIVDTPGMLSSMLDTPRLQNIYDRISGTDNASMVLKNGKYFMVLDPQGMIPENGTTSRFGMYGDDTRFLNSWQIKLNGQTPELVIGSVEKGYAGRFEYQPRAGSDPQLDGISLTNDVVMVKDGLAQKITVRNESGEPRAINLSLAFNSDFRDMFEVRGWQRGNRGEMQPAVVSPDQGAVSLSYVGLDNSRLTTDVALRSGTPYAVKENSADYRFSLQPGSEKSIEVTIAPGTNKAAGAEVVLPFEETLRKAEQDYANWRKSITTVESDNRVFNQMMERSYRDYYMLQLPMDRGEAIAAGIPWFVSPFGRDQLIAGFQSIGFMPEKAGGVLRHLGEFQGTKDNPTTGEKPGKIMHELRVGEMGRNGEIPFAPNYNTVDATPLYVSLLGKTVEWTGDKALARELRPNMERALEYIDRETEATGYLRYGGNTKDALSNQGWKDSGDSIMHKDGTLAKGPIALSEVQGYLYSAWREAAKLYESWGENEKAQAYNKKADDLKERFNRDFWMPDQNFVALALDGQGKQTEVVSSNPGHVLMTGLLTPEHAFAVESRLFKQDMFSGYGIRTLAEGQPRYHPGSYHDGSVWPHDNSMINAGVHDLVPASGDGPKLMDSLFDAAMHHPNYRLPELFAGFPREQFGSPIPYPVSSVPQAWAAGSMMQMLRSNLGLHGNAATNSLLVFKPTLPSSFSTLKLSGLPIGQNRVDLQFKRIGPDTHTEILNNPGSVDIQIHNVTTEQGRPTS